MSVFLRLQIWISCTSDWTQNGAIKMTIIYKQIQDFSKYQMVSGQLLPQQSLRGFIFAPQTFPLVGVFVVYRHALSDLNSCQDINRTV